MEHEFLEGEGDSMMFLVLSTTIFIVDQNSVKNRLPTKITSLEGYKGMKNDACGLALKLGYSDSKVVFTWKIQSGYPAPPRVGLCRGGAGVPKSGGF
jgi:hypothetical protein